jgi:uncharacterized membrane protein SpoIIM required for sporulation
MKVADLLESRRKNWRELEVLCMQMESRNKRALGAAAVSRFATLYRAACADLALADAYQLPRNTVNYLHRLVGRAHNQLYRSSSFDFALWGREMLVEVPQRLFRDNCLRLAFFLFWGVFLGSMSCAYVSPAFTGELLGKEMIQTMEEMYAEPVSGRDPDAGGLMAGFYVWHNAGIGLQCFAAGLLLGVGGMFITVSNAAILGAVFGHMATVEPPPNAPWPGPFFDFVAAHAPFELTAIVLSAAAGMRLGFAIIDTGGWTRGASLRKAAQEVVPTVCAAIILFCLAAIIEGFVSPSALPFTLKAIVMVFTSGLLMFYFVMLGYPRE